ncbi:MAG: cytosine deaminase [Paracoccaceae bacterium]|nr:cytosine deaminase [Paracoccaceae bacterium]MDE2758981.1 cytosine deaminase [Paracoccaceae bacterium]MDE2918073.1 cytosine deaminase [Paracoccaceae bacterium]
MDYINLPSTNNWTVENVVIPKILPDGKLHFRKSSISVGDGKIIADKCENTVDGQGGLVFPLFVDMHTHIDKGHIWPRSPNPDGTFEGALNTVLNDRTGNWKAEDVHQRMNFALKCAYAHGTRAIRTHLDSASPQHRISWPVFRETREEWKNKIELQAVTILGIDMIDLSFLEIADTAHSSNGVLGCVTYPCPDLADRIRTFLQIARERQMAVDFHTDETKDASSNSLKEIALAVIETDFEYPVTVGHCCSLAQQEKSEAEETLDLVAEAGMNVVSLPMCNMYLQDRGTEATPRWRGVTLVHEMARKGINVSFASDNTRDPFYAYGDLDMVEVMRQATRICHLDHSSFPWFGSFNEIPARVCGFQDMKLEPGYPADFVLFKGRNMNEFFSRPQMDRVVVRKGKQIDRKLPDYSELDHLMEV